MKLFHWIKNIATKQSAVNRALTLFLPLGQGISTRADYAPLAKEGFATNSVVFAYPSLRLAGFH